MVKKNIRKPTYYRKKYGGVKKTIRRAIKSYKRRIFKRRELKNAEMKYITVSNNVFPVINVTSSLDVPSQFHDVTFASIPSEGAGVDERVGLKYRQLYSKVKLSYSNASAAATNWISGFIGMVVVKELVYKGLTNSDGTIVKVNELFFNNTNPHYPAQDPKRLGRYTVKVYLKRISAPQVTAVGVGMDAANYPRNAVWAKKFKINKNRHLHSVIAPFLQVPKTFIALMYFAPPWTEVSGTVGTGQMYSEHFYKEL